VIKERRWAFDGCSRGVQAVAGLARRTSPKLTAAWGFGLWLKVGPAAGLALALALFIFFAVQVPWSLWWLRRHERGPLEALWARVTYGPRTAETGG
jgi:hypothetical protein